MAMPATAGGRWQLGPCLPPNSALTPPPPFPIDSGRRQEHQEAALPPAHPQSSHRKAQLGFPHPEGIKKV